MVIPHLFRCPISLDLFTDPVTLCTGQTYDRSSIEKWLAGGNLTCPVTMQKLHNPSLVPNHTLRQLIQQWLQMSHLIDPDYPKRPDNDNSLVSMKYILNSHEATADKKLQVVQDIQVLLEESSSRSAFLQLGFVPLLLAMLFGKEESEFPKDHVKFVEHTLDCALKLLALGGQESLNMLKEGSSFSSCLARFQHGTTVIKISMCKLVETTLMSSETNDLGAMLGQSRELLHQIVLLLHHHDSKASEAAIKAISALCFMQASQTHLVREGVVDGLIMYILGAENKRHERRLAPLAVSIIKTLLDLEEAKEAVLDHQKGVIALVKMVFRVSDHEGSENAVDCLKTICVNSIEAIEEAITAGILTQLLLLLQSQCSGRTKTKARMLLKLLRNTKQ